MKPIGPDKFVGWTPQRASYLHPFGRYGAPADGPTFQHRYLRARLEGATEDFEQYSLTTAAARSGKFEFPATDPRTLLSTLGYAYHFDASLYSRYLRERSEQKGVRRHEGKIEQVDLHCTGGGTAGISTRRAASSRRCVPIAAPASRAICSSIARACAVC